MATPAFAALPEAQKQPYLDAFHKAGDRGELAPEQQRGVIANVMQHNEKGPIQQYFALPPGKERERYLDKVIDRQREMEQQSPLPPPQGAGPKEIRFEGKGLAESVAPEDRAAMD